MTIPRQLLTIVRKDLLLEWRGRSRILSVVLFGVVTLLLFSFAIGPDSIMLRAAGGGFLVLALLLSSILSLSESFRVEQENRAIEGLLLLPGQGLITMVIGVLLIDFPGKRGIELRFARMRPVRRTLDWIRARAGKPPLRFPERKRTS